MEYAGGGIAARCRLSIAMAGTVETVLIVEDDAGVVALERRRLEGAGYRVVTAENAAAARSQLATEPISLILLDHGLPGELDGLSFYGHLREEGWDIPVILVTGFSDAGTAIRALRSGVRDFVTKSREYLDYVPEAVRRVLHQVHMERRLAESEARLGAIIASAQDAILAVDATGAVTLFNPAAERMFGCAANDAMGRAATLFLPEIASSDNGQMSPSSTSMEWGLRSNGERFPVEVSQSGTDDYGAGSRTLIVRDVTDRRRLEAQLRQAQRMEAVGRLAGGVAHDFNNLLTVISGYTEMILDDLPSGDRLRDPVLMMRQAGEQAAALTSQLLAFSRRQVVEPQVIELNGIVSNLTKMLRRLIGEDIELSVSLASDLDRVRIDPRQVEQILMNLSVNARDAMPHGGRVTIETANAAIDEHFAQFTPGLPPGRYVLLAVTDSGLGMDEGTRSRIFEPFFTTKDPGKGTGLGLAMVYSIVQQAKGHIEVYSEIEHGTVFKLYLPSVDGVDQPSDAADDDSAQLQGTETILLVEDAEGVRALLQDVLTLYGHQVLVARDGEEGIRLADDHQGPIDLIITDIVMPRMGGRELVERVVAGRPKIRALYLSGYTDEAVMRHGVLEAGSAFLQKPFTARQLMTKVRQVLDA
jgi:two-component system, cell cycle sensor histidine kinase and response regulator CckA